MDDTKFTSEITGDVSSKESAASGADDVSQGEKNNESKSSSLEEVHNFAILCCIQKETKFCAL